MKRFILFLLLFSAANATVRTIGTGGGAPNYSTIQTAVTAAVAGDVLQIVEAKTYTETVSLASSGNSGAHITLQNTSGGLVTVSSTSSPVLTIGNRDYWDFIGSSFGITFTYTGSGAAGTSIIGAVTTSTADHVTFTNINTVAAGGALGTSQNDYEWYFRGVDSFTFTDCSANVTSGSSHEGWDGMELMDCTNVTITNMTVSASDPTKRDDGIVFSGDNLTIQGGTIASGQSANFTDFHPDGIVIQGKLSVADSTNIIINGVNVRDFDQCIYLDPIWGNLASVRISNSIIQQTAAWVHAGTVKGLVIEGENNLGSATYKVQLGFYNNVVDTRGAQIRNLRQISTAAANDKTFNNNLFINTPSAGLEFGTGNNILNVTLNYNYIDSAGSTTLYNWSGGNRTIATMQGTYSQEINSVRGSPGVVSSSDYRAASSTSGIVGIGTDLSGTFTADYLSILRTTPWVIGAYGFPKTPTGLTAGTPTISTIPLTWTDASSANCQFIVEQSPNGSTGWATINTTALGATSYTATGLSASTTYYFRVSGTNGDGTTPVTSNASATTSGSSTANHGMAGTARLTGTAQIK